MIHVFQMTDPSSHVVYENTHCPYTSTFSVSLMLTILSSPGTPIIGDEEMQFVNLHEGEVDNSKSD